MRKHVTKRTWTDEETEKFKSLLAQGISPERMSVIFKRSTMAVKQKARQLGTPFPKRTRFAHGPQQNYTDGFYRP